MSKYTSSSSKRCILEVNLEYPKELRQLHNDYPLAPNKIEIKKINVVELSTKDYWYLPNAYW